MTSGADTKAMYFVKYEWTDERVAEITRLRVTEGLSASQVAARMGITRNAAMGKLHRLGLLERRVQTPRREYNGQKARNPREMAVSVRLGRAKMKGAATLDEALKKIKPEPRKIGGSVWNVLPGTTPISLLDATDARCRWPIGDPLEPGFGFCGCAVAEGSVYCATHSAIGTTNFKATADDKRKLQKSDLSGRVFA
jgi:GcrA cell cycle regulator